MNDKQIPRAPIDLDEFERQLRAMQTQPKHDIPDPLAELARIVGQDDHHGLAKNQTHASSIFDELSNLRDQRIHSHSNQVNPHLSDSDQSMFKLDEAQATFKTSNVHLNGQPFAGDPPEFLTENRNNYDSGYDAPPTLTPSRFGIKIFGALVGLGSLAVAGVWGFSSLQNNHAKMAENAPIISAKANPVKEKPANPGGAEVPNLNADILQKSKEASKETPKLVVREEQPVDLSQAIKKDIRRVDLGQAGENGATPVVLVPVPNAQTNAGSGNAAAGTAVALGAAAAIVLPYVTSPPANSVLPVAKPAPTQPAPTTSAPPLVSILPTPTSSSGPKKVKSVSITTNDPVQIHAKDEAVTAAPKPKPAPKVATPKPVKLVPAQPKPASDVAVRGDAVDAAGDTPLQITPPAGVSRKGQKVAAVTPTSVKISKPAKDAEEADAAPDVPATGGKFSVQFGAPGSTAEAQNLIGKLKSKYPSVIGAAGTRVIKAQVNGKDVYRVRSGSVSREKANSICADMKAAGGNCFISGG
jgi:SPOR domain